MADATVTKRIQVHDPNVEVVQLTCSDGETYTSQKFGKVNGAVACANTNSDAEMNVVTDGTSVVTINWASVTDGLMTLVLYGQLGN